MQDFTRAFTDADKVLLLDVYGAGEDNPTGVQATDLANQLPNGSYVGDFQSARLVLEGLVGPDDLLVLMGAGDIRKLGDELAQRV
jgi:UDP-N-acetylmuramate--alanine ligase